MTDRPNILFIQVDQLTAQTLKSYGDGFVMRQRWMPWPQMGWCLKRPIATFPLCPIAVFNGNRAVVFNGWRL